MSALIVSTFVTLDGVMEAPGGEPSHPHTGWVEPHFSPELEEYKFKEVLDADILLVGRVTYESFAGAWPTYEGPFADRMNSMPKVVVSTTLTDPEWTNTTVISGDVVDGVRALKERSAGPVVVCGSATLTHTLLGADLVDELRMISFPVTIGAGIRLFSDTVRKSVWSCDETLPLPNGVRIDVLHRT